MRIANPNRNILFLKKIIALLAFLFFGLNVYSQSYPYRHFTVKDGLPSSEVYHVYQGSKGYIWIATDDGVSRYDGYEFKNFTKTDGLPDNTVFEIFEDYKGRIWFVPHSINLSYYFNDSIFQYLYNDTIQSYLKGNGNPRKQVFYVDSLDNVYFKDKKTYHTYVIDSTGRVTFPIIDINKIWYFTKGNKLFQGNYYLKKRPFNTSIYNEKQDIINSIKTPDNYLKLLYSPYGASGIKNGDNYIVNHGNYLGFYNNSNPPIFKKFTHIIWISIFENDLWVGTFNGAYCFRNCNLNETPKYFLKNKRVSSVLKDKEGGYWFSTLQKGVFYLPNIQIQNVNTEHGLKSNVVTAIEKESTKLWFGFNNDMLLEYESGQFNNEIKLKNESLITYKMYFDSLKSNLWIGANTLYLVKNSELKNLNLFQELGSPYAIVRDIIVDTNQVWLATILGLMKYTIKTDSIVREGKFNYKINSLLKLSDEEILLGCNNGVWKYHINDKKFNYIGDSNPLLSSKVRCFLYNSINKNIWIGTSTNGIVVFDNDTVFNISSNDGLSNNSVTSLYLKSNTIWAATNNGLNRITLSGNAGKPGFKIENFNTQHGLASYEINNLYIDDSIAYVATQEGLNTIEYKHIKSNDLAPPVYIKNIQIKDKDTTLKKHYELSYEQNEINIEYVGLMYRNNQEKRYKYSLQRHNEEVNWSDITENTIRLSYLPPGNYVFRVKAVNENDIESIEPASLSFKINKPYWRTWWFISIIVLISGSTAFALYHSRIKEINKRNNLEKKLLKQVNKFRQQALSQQMNPHFIFNTLNSIQYYIISNEPISSTRYLAKFSKLMRIILNNSQYETIPIQHELEALDLYLELEALRLKNNIEYDIIVDEKIDTSIYRIFPLLLQPYVENAIWHGLNNKDGDRYLKIEIKANHDFIICTIEDNGIGREKAMEIKNQKKSTHKSHGTEITNKRMDVINKLYHRNFKVGIIDLKDNMGQACGTKVIIHIPFITN